jgi:hypothetical protein
MLPTKLGFLNIEVKPTTNPKNAKIIDGISIAPPKR